MKIRGWQKILMLSFLVFPAGSLYKLDGFAFGGGAAANIGSSNYSIQGRIGGENSGQSVGATYDLGAGLAFERQLAAPNKPAWTNPGGAYYNKLHLVIDSSGFPGDTKFAVAISPDNFVTTDYVQSDGTVGVAWTMPDYQTYDQWLDGTGIDVTGLSVGTTYYVKVKAMQGKYSESAWGPTAVTGTGQNATLTFSVSPNQINLGDLTPGNVVTSAGNVTVNLSTNAGGGGNVYVYGQNGGLYSVTANYNIGATTADLTSVDHGFGIQGTGSTQTGGGPLTVAAPYNGSGSIVGAEDATVRNIFSSAAAVSGGQGTFVIKAKSNNSTPSASDYTEVLTVVASANF